MSKHTPGPWSVAPRGGEYQVVPSTNHEREQLERIGALTFVALSVGTSSGQVAIIPMDESNRANATLIAAASDLYEALLDLIHQMRQPPDENGKHKLDMNQSITAINKARGEV